MSRECPRVAILAYSPAPYRVELFDEIARRGRIHLTGLYVHRQEPGRLWSEVPMAHEAVYLQEDAAGKALQTVQEADFAVISFFDHAKARALWRARIDTGNPWAFWGEKPGAQRRSFLGRVARRWRLRDLVSSNAPVWCIGSWAEAAYRAEFGHERAVSNLPYFSDLGRFKTQRAKGGRRLLFSGSLIQRKGVDLLLRAFLQLADVFPDITLSLAGSGPMEAHLRQEASPLGGRVLFTGFVPWDQLPALYAEHDLLAVPSRYDGWGMVVPEGLASGMPVICSDQVGAGHDLVKPGINGWICPAGNVDALSAAIQQAGRLSVDEWQTMSAAATESVAGHQLRDGAERLEALCFKALASWKAGGVSSRQ